MTQIILASQSPRRKELLDKMGLTFTTIPSSYEEHLDESRSAEDVAKELALGKALDVAASHPDAYVIGSDTIVAIRGRQMEKPIDIDDAREMLTALAGHESTVSTGLAVVNLAHNVQIADVDTARVFFKPDSTEVSELREIYIASNDWKDKAGGYGIQSGAAVLIERIEGNYDTIVGLPTIKLSKIIGSLGVNAKSVVEKAPVVQTIIHK